MRKSFSYLVVLSLYFLELSLPMRVQAEVPAELKQKKEQFFRGLKLAGNTNLSYKHLDNVLNRGKKLHQEMILAGDPQADDFENKVLNKMKGLKAAKKQLSKCHCFRDKKLDKGGRCGIDLSVGFNLGVLSQINYCNDEISIDPSLEGLNIFLEDNLKIQEEMGAAEKEKKKKEFAELIYKQTRQDLLLPLSQVYSQFVGPLKPSDFGKAGGPFADVPLRKEDADHLGMITRILSYGPKNQDDIDKNRKKMFKDISDSSEKLFHHLEGDRQMEAAQETFGTLFPSAFDQDRTAPWAPELKRELDFVNGKPIAVEVPWGKKDKDEDSSPFRTRIYNPGLETWNAENAGTRANPVLGGGNTLVEMFTKNPDEMKKIRVDRWVKDSNFHLAMKRYLANKHGVLMGEVKAGENESQRRARTEYAEAEMKDFIIKVLPDGTFLTGDGSASKENAEKGMELKRKIAEDWIKELDANIETSVQLYLEKDDADRVQGSIKLDQNNPKLQVIQQKANETKEKIQEATSNLRIVPPLTSQPPVQSGPIGLTLPVTPEEQVRRDMLSKNLLQRPGFPGGGTDYSASLGVMINQSFRNAYFNAGDDLSASGEKSGGGDYNRGLFSRLNKGSLDHYAKSRALRDHMKSNPMFHDQFNHELMMASLSGSSRGIPEADLQKALDHYIDNSKELLKKLDEKYQEGDPDAMIKSAIKRNPGLIARVLGDHPEFADIACEMQQGIVDDKNSEEMWDKVFMGVGVALFVGAVILTAGGALATAPAWFAAAGGVLAATGTVVSGASLIRNTANYLEAAAEADEATNYLVALGVGSPEEIKELVDKANGHLFDAVVDGAMVAVDVITFGVSRGLRALKSAEQAERALASAAKNGDDAVKLAERGVKEVEEATKVGTKTAARAGVVAVEASAKNTVRETEEVLETALKSREAVEILKGSRQLKPKQLEDIAKGLKSLTQEELGLFEELLQKGYKFCK